jgi:2-keto-4-pentenoate hydratase
MKASFKKATNSSIRATVGMLALAAMALTSFRVHAQAGHGCSLQSWADDVVAAWKERGMLTNASCYADIITSMDIGRQMRDRVVAEFDQMFPRAGYKVVALDPVNAKLPGVDRPMVGVMYLPMFYPNGATVPLSSAAKLITEPDFLISVADEGINDVDTLEEALPHLDHIYAFIEVLGPVFDNSPPNPFMMQASNLMARSGVIGESIEVSPTPEFLHSLETMKVTFKDGTGKVLAEEPGSYLGENPLNGVLVVVRELRRLGERLQPGDIISAGSYMPPMPVTSGLYTETIYEGIGGKTLHVSASYR